MPTKTAIITGGASGMGLTEARLLAEHGYEVMILDINADGLNDAVTSITDAGGSAEGHQLDLTDHDAINSTVARIRDSRDSIDVLVNNAGVFDKYLTSLDTPREKWDFLLSINLTSVFDMTNAVLPHMLKAGSGAIINIASVAGVVAGKGGAAYTTTKHAVIGYTKHIASAYGPEGIRCNAVLPGTIETPLIAEVADSIPKDAIPSRRFGRPEEVAELVAFIASDKAAFINGAAITIDGGFTAQ